MKDRLAFGVVLLCLLSVTTTAQLGGGKRRVGDSPTPGTPQPAPPNLADRVTFTGCVRAAAQTGSGSQATATDPNTPSDARYVLSNAERQNIVPAGTGGSAVAAKAPSGTYRLEAIDAQLSPFVGAKVEISGQIKSGPTPAPAEARNSNPTLQVEFVRRLAGSCP
jgi:hypothetical protein